MCPDIVETKLLTQRQREWQPDKQVIDKWTVLYNLQKDYMDRMKPKIEDMKSYDEVLGQKLKKERVEKQNLSNLIQFQNKVNTELKSKSGGSSNKFEKDDVSEDEDQSYNRGKTTATKKISSHLSDFNKLLMKRIKEDNPKETGITSNNKEKLAESMKNFFNNNINYKSLNSDKNQSNLSDNDDGLQKDEDKQIHSSMYSDIKPISSMQSSNNNYLPIPQSIPIPSPMINFDVVQPNPVIYSEPIEDPLKAFEEYGKSFIKDSSLEKKKKIKKQTTVKKLKGKNHDGDEKKIKQKNMNNTSVLYTPSIEIEKEEDLIKYSPQNDAPKDVFYNYTIYNTGEDEEKSNQENDKNIEGDIDEKKEKDENEKHEEDLIINTENGNEEELIQNEEDKNHTEIKGVRNIVTPSISTNNTRTSTKKNEIHPKLKNKMKKSVPEERPTTKIHNIDPPTDYSQRTPNQNTTKQIIGIKSNPANTDQKNKSNLRKLTTKANPKRNETNSIILKNDKKVIQPNNTTTHQENHEVSSKAPIITQIPIPLENDSLNLDMKSLLQKNESVIKNPHDEISKLSSQLKKGAAYSIDQPEDSEEVLDQDEDPLERFNKNIVSPPQMASFLETAEFINFNKNLFETLIAKSSNFNLETQRRGRRRSRFPDPQWDCAESQISKLVIYLCEEETSSSYQKYCKPIFEQINTMVESFLYHDNNLEICQNLHMCPVTMDIK